VPSLPQEPDLPRVTRGTTHLTDLAAHNLEDIPLLTCLDHARSGRRLLGSQTPSDDEKEYDKGDPEDPVPPVDRHLLVIPVHQPLLSGCAAHA